MPDTPSPPIYKKGQLRSALRMNSHQVKGGDEDFARNCIAIAQMNPKHKVTQRFRMSIRDHIVVGRLIE